MGQGGREIRALPQAPGLEAKAEMRRWVDRWKIVGPILEQERWVRLSTATDEKLRQQSMDLLALWTPGVPGDDGEAILEQQRTFARLGVRAKP